MKLIPALALSILMSVPIMTKEKSNTDITYGVKLFKQGKYESSFQILYPYAKSGNPRAQFTIGLLYDMGSIRLMDKNKAVEWYKKAADQGLADAEYDMGVMLSKGEGIYKNLSQSKEWYEKAAKQNHGYALYNLGVIYEKGYAVKKDFAKAKEYYIRAIDRGISKAAYNLANHYYKSKDYTKAFKYYLMAAEQSHAKSQFHVAWMYQHSKGTIRDIDKAKKWYKESAINGNKNAAKNYGLLLKQGGDLDESKYWLERGSSL